MFREPTRVVYVFRVIGEHYLSSPLLSPILETPLPPPAGFYFALLKQEPTLPGTDLPRTARRLVSPAKARRHGGTSLLKPLSFVHVAAVCLGAAQTKTRGAPLWEKPRCSCRGFSFCAIHEVLALFRAYS